MQQMLCYEHWSFGQYTVGGIPMHRVFSPLCVAQMLRGRSGLHHQNLTNNIRENHGLCTHD
jgi:hypothetical protein